MTPRHLILFAIAVALIVLISALADILLPFVLGFALAYFLDPVADALERVGLPRIVATAMITLAVAGIFVAILFAGAPALLAQLQHLVEAVPRYVARIQDWVGLHSDILPPVEEIIGNVQSIGNYVFQSGSSFISTVGLLFITPIVAIYMLNDWDRMVARINALLPASIAPSIREIATEIDATLAGFLRGQIMVCALLAIFYATALYFLGLKGGIAVGLIAGIVTFIPYVGAISGIGLASFLAIGQFGLAWESLLPIIGVFIVGQFLEGNILTPRLIGDRVRLHPVWILFALLAMGTLLGFLGLLLAVPLAAVIGVLVRFAFRHYATSK